MSEARKSVRLSKVLFPPKWKNPCTFICLCINFLSCVHQIYKKKVLGEFSFCKNKKGWGKFRRKRTAGIKDGQITTGISLDEKGKMRVSLAN